MKKAIVSILALGLAASMIIGLQAGEKKECAKCTAAEACTACADAKEIEAAKKAGFKEVEYKVAGLSCSACENKLTKALTSLEGVKKPSACAKGENAKLLFHPKKVKKAELIAAIEKAGYKVEGEVLNVKVDGLACGACSTKVGKALTSLKGVKGQEVCHESNKAVVTFDPKAISSEDVIAAIGKSGFKVVQ